MSILGYELDNIVIEIPNNLILLKGRVIRKSLKLCKIVNILI